MSASLPSRPNLNHLKNQAKDIIKAHKQGDAEVCGVLKNLHRFSDSSDQEILSSEIALHEAQYALAMGHGFSSWDALKKHVESVIGTGSVAHLKRENGSVIIEGIPKLTWGKSGECTYPGALAAA